MAGGSQGRAGAAAVVAILGIAFVVGLRTGGRSESAAVAPTAPEVPAVHVVGRVEDEQGGRVSASVRLFATPVRKPSLDLTPADALASTTVDAHGEFGLDVRGSGPALVRVEPEGLLPRWMFVDLEVGKPATLTLGTRTLGGRVLDPEGRPAASADVTVAISPWGTDPRHDDRKAHMVCLRTADDGTFRVERIPRALCVVNVRATMFDGEPWQEQGLVWLSDAQAHVDLGSGIRKTRVKGRVHGASGAAFPPWTVLAFVGAADPKLRFRCGVGSDGAYVARLATGSFRADLIPADVHAAPSPLDDATGKPAILEVRAGAPDPTLDLYLPAK